MKNRLDTIFHIFVIGFWVIMMGLLVVKEFLPEKIPPQKIRFPKELPYIKNWGIYTKTGRIGYLQTGFTSEQAGYQWKNKIEIRLRQDSTISINSTTLFDRDEKLQNFHIDLSYEDLVVDIAGAIKKDILKLLVKTNYGEDKPRPCAQGRGEYTLPWYTDSDIMGNALIPWFYISSLKVGDKFQWYLLNPLTQRKDLVKAVVKRTTFYYNKSTPTMYTGRQDVPVMVVDVYYEDMKLEFWVDNEGEPLKVVTPWGWELEAE